MLTKKNAACKKTAARAARTIEPMFAIVLQNRRENGPPVVTDVCDRQSAREWVKWWNQPNKSRRGVRASVRPVAVLFA